MVALMLLIVGCALLLAGMCIVLVLSGPRLRVAEERERVEREARFAQWRLHQVTSAVMQRLLDEARRQP